MNVSILYKDIHSLSEVFSEIVLDLIRVIMLHLGQVCIDVLDTERYFPNLRGNYFVVECYDSGQLSCNCQTP